MAPKIPICLIMSIVGVVEHTKEMEKLVGQHHIVIRVDIPDGEIPTEECGLHLENQKRIANEFSNIYQMR